MDVYLLVPWHPLEERIRASLRVYGIQDFYFEEIRVFTAGNRFGYISME